MASLFRLDYDDFRSISSQMSNESQHVEQLFNDLKRRIDQLVPRGWQGDAATKFEEEMTNLLLPAIERLSKALEAGSRVAGKIEQIVQSADQEASNLFKNIF